MGQLASMVETMYLRSGGAFLLDVLRQETCKKEKWKTP